MAKIVALTGGTTGIGAAVAQRMIERDCEVHVLDVVKPARADVRYIPCDLGDPLSIDACVAKLPDRIDVLISVAGIAGARGDRSAIAVNFLGMRHLVERALARIVDGGAVVNVASTAGWDWQKRRDDVTSMLDTRDFASGLAWLAAHPDAWRENPYKFSKQCAAAYTYRAAGLAVSRGVRVNCVNPGAVETKLTPAFRELVGPAMYDWGVAQIGRHGRPADIAEVIEFLAVGPCGWLNGVEIVVDGGYIAGIVGGWVDLEASPRPPAT